MLTSKQRATLRGIAAKMETIFQVGKGGVNDEMVLQLSNALEARELIKIKVLDNSMESAKSAANIFGESLSADVVGVIGNKIILYRPSSKKRVIEI